MIKKIFRGSSKGRTVAFGAINRGSNPCPRAILMVDNLTADVRDNLPLANYE